VASKLRLFAAPLIVRRPKVLLDVQKSFAPLKHDEIPDFHGYKRRSAADGRRQVYRLSEEEMDIASACIAQGLAWKYATRLIFSPDKERPDSLASISADKQKAAKLYLEYLRRNGVKVHDVRRGMTGMLRERVVETCGQILAYHLKKIVTAKSG
jgi:hypothetical protein